MHDTCAAAACATALSARNIMLATLVVKKLVKLVKR